MSSVQAVAPAPPVSNVNKKSNKRFLMFVHILMKYLEEKDKTMCATAKFLRNLRLCQKEENWRSRLSLLECEMQTRLKRLIGVAYWKKAEDCLSSYLKQQLLNDQPSLGDERRPSKQGQCQWKLSRLSIERYCA